MHQHLSTVAARRRLNAVREARIAAGRDLEQVAQRSRIPAALIEEFERGDLSRWPRERYGRTQLVRYARAAELNPEWVVASVLPLLDGSSLEGNAGDIQAGPPSGGIQIIASSFDANEELFASEEAPATTGAAPDPTSAASKTRQSGQAPVRGIVASPPRRQRRRSRQSTSVRGLVGAAAAILICLAAVRWHTPVSHAIPSAPLRGSSKAATPPSGSESPLPEPVHQSAADAPAEVRSPARADTSPHVPLPVEPRPAEHESVGQPAAAIADAPAGDDQPQAVTTTAGDVAEAANTLEAPPQPIEPAAGEPPLSLTDARPAEGLASDAVVYSPAFAATGTAMYFQREKGRGTALMRAETDAAGRVLRATAVVDDGADNFHVRPSPDEQRIAFDSDREGTRGVYVADRNGRDARRVSGPGYAAVPSWSPDGRSLVFVRAEPSQPRVWNLWQLTLASGELRQLTSYKVGQPWGASWFPDGHRVAFSHETALVVLDLETGLRQVYPSPRAARLVRTPAVSPSGGEILFQVFRDGVWVLDLASGSMHRVLDDPSAEEYAWSPDGQKVAYHSRRSGRWGLWVASAH